MDFSEIENNMQGGSSTWISKIADTINGVMEKVRQPLSKLNKIPSILLLCEIMNRPGLSAISLTSAIIARLPEAGIYTGTGKDGKENMVNQFVKIVSEELIKEIHDNAVVQGSIDIGQITITGQGGNAGGPVVITGQNINMPEINGLIR